MDPDTVFNRYDIRGTYPDEIDEAFAERLGRAVGTFSQQQGRGTVVIGRDTRETSAAVHAAARDGIRTAGAQVIDAGIGPSDRTALAAQHYGGIGVMVTASHHDWNRTGFKLLYEQGNGFSNEDLAQVQSLFRTDDGPGAEGSLLSSQHEFDEHYQERVQDAFQTYSEEIPGRVVVDPAGAGNRAAPALFESLGADVIPMERGSLPDPDPSRRNREDVEGYLAKEDADLAVGYDPDADRVYAIHPDLGWIDGDRICYALGVITRADRVVASIDSSPLLETLDAQVTYTRVGDVFVAAEGLEQDADLLGEPNGHYAVTDFCWYNSGIFSSLLLAAHADQLPDILAPVDAFWTERFVETYDDTDARDAAMQNVKKQVAQQYDVVSRVDGVKFESDDVTGLVRASGTSPKIRLTVHGRDGGTEAAEHVRSQIF